MSSQDQTASFMIRFTQRIYEDENGEANVQWRGNVSHVQGNKQKNFSELKDAMKFIQDKLSEMTLSSIEEDVSAEEKEGILNKSLDMWKKFAVSYPKLVVDAIKDPKAQVSQIQDQITSKAGEISSRLDLESLKPPSKNDINALSGQIADLTSLVTKLQKKVDKLDKKIS